MNTLKPLGLHQIFFFLVIMPFGVNSKICRYILSRKILPFLPLPLSILVSKCAEVFFPHTKQFSDSPTVAGCLTIVLSSDTAYLETASDPTVWRLRPQDCPHCKCQPQVQVVTHASGWVAINRRFLWPPPWVWSSARTAHRTQGNSLLTI